VEIPLEIDPISFKKALNSNLPKDIEVLMCEESTEKFHPVRDAKKKEYRYYFKMGREKSPFDHELISKCSFELNLELMQKACEIFVGEHDFQNYFCTGTPVNSTVRTIFECELNKLHGEGLFSNFSGEYYEFRVVGSGFLKQMVRLMVGAAWAVAAGKHNLKDLERSLSGPLYQKVGATAPPEGLYLYSVEY